jgi:hypothetical protein
VFLLSRIIRKHKITNFCSWHYNAAIEKHENEGLVAPSFEAVKERVIGKNAAAPSMDEAKDFFRFVIDTSKGLITTNGRPTAESMKTAAENFYRAFTDKTETKTDPQQHSEIYRVSVRPLALPFGHPSYTEVVD